MLDNYQLQVLIASPFPDSLRSPCCCFIPWLLPDCPQRFRQGLRYIYARTSRVLDVHQAVLYTT
jgi:hypothetical protein